MQNHYFIVLFSANVVIPQRGFNPGLAAQQGQVAGFVTIATLQIYLDKLGPETMTCQKHAIFNLQ